jgi:hypothetical protein
MLTGLLMLVATAGLHGQSSRLDAEVEAVDYLSAQR